MLDGNRKGHATLLSCRQVSAHGRFLPCKLWHLRVPFFCGVELTVAQIGSSDVGGSERTKRMRALRFLGLAVTIIAIGGFTAGTVVMSLAGALP